jgi:hypothetical protein
MENQGLSNSYLRISMKRQGEILEPFRLDTLFTAACGQSDGADRQKGCRD